MQKVPGVVKVLVALLPALVPGPVHVVPLLQSQSHAVKPGMIEYDVLANLTVKGAQPCVSIGLNELESHAVWMVIFFRSWQPVVELYATRVIEHVSQYGKSLKGEVRVLESPVQKYHL